MLAGGVTPLGKPGDTMSWLDNGVIKLGVNLSKGGALTYLSPSGSTANMINNHDLGRQVQQSYYSGPDDFHPAGTTQNSTWSPWPWNPIQTGDSFGYAGQVLANSNTGGVIYTRSTPMQWALKDVPGDAVFEQWSHLEGSAVRSHVRLTMQRTDTTQYPARSQELPAVYTIGTLYRLFSYTGTQPFTNGSLTEIGSPWPWQSFRATEGWAALVDNSMWGLGVRHFDSKSFVGGYYATGTIGTGGEFGDNTGYIAPTHFEVLDHNLVYEFDFDLVVGSLSEIRTWVYDHPAAGAKPDFRFQNDRQHWFCTNTTDAAIPAGKATINLGVSDPYMTGPATAFRASDVPRLFITARYNLQPSPLSTTAQLYWETDNVNTFSGTQSRLFTILPDGLWHTYEIDLSGTPSWQGLISKLRFDPVGLGRAGETVDIQSISFQNINNVQTVDTSSYVSGIAGHAGQNVRLTSGETVAASTAVNGLVLQNGASGITLNVATGQSLGISSGTLVAQGPVTHTIAGGGAVSLGDGGSTMGEGFVYVDGQLNAQIPLAESASGMWLAKGGPGTLSLYTAPLFSGGIAVYDGTLAPAVSNVIPNLPLVLDGRLLLGSGITETTGRISGSSAGTGLIDLSAGTALAVDTSAGTSDYYGRITGPSTASLTKIGVNNWQLRGTSDYAGRAVVDGGYLLLTGPAGQATNAARWEVRSGGLILSNSAGNVLSNRLDHEISLQGGEFRVTGPADATAVNESIGGTLSLDRGRSTITLDPDVTQSTYGDVTFTAASLGRTGASTALLRADSFGQDTTSPDSRLYFTTAPALSHAGGSAANLNEGTIPYLLLDPLAVGSTTGCELLTYDPVLGLKIITGYASTIASGADKNVRLSADETLVSSSAVRALSLTNSGTAVRLTPGASNQLTVASGVIAGTGTVTNQIGTSTSNGGTLTFGPNNATGTEGIFHLRNGLVVYSRIIDNGSQTVSVTKDGGGTLQLSNASTYRGGTTVHQGAVSVYNTSGSATGSGPVEFFGGTLAGGNTTGTGGLLDGRVTLHSGSILSPGGTTAILTLRNGLVLDGGSLKVDVHSAVAGTGYDQVKLTAGDLTLQNNPTLTIGDLTGLVPGRDILTVVNNTGAGTTTGQFAGLPEGAAIQLAGTNYYISYHGGDGNDVTLSSAAILKGRRLFYNDSSLDGNNPAANASDDPAIDSTKSALLPGNGSGPANISGYSKGINGLMLDVQYLWNSGTIAASDFVFEVADSPSATTWLAAPSPQSITVRPGAGAGASDRVTVVWTNGAIVGRWLRVRLNSAATGLAQDDVFLFASQSGDSNGDGKVDFADLVKVSQNYKKSTTSGSADGDFNGDGKVDFADLVLVSQNYKKSLAGGVASFSAIAPIQVSLNATPINLETADTTTFSADQAPVDPPATLAISSVADISDQLIVESFTLPPVRIQQRSVQVSDPPKPAGTVAVASPPLPATSSSPGKSRAGQAPVARAPFLGFRAVSGKPPVHRSVHPIKIARPAAFTFSAPMKTPAPAQARPFSISRISWLRDSDEQEFPRSPSL